MDIFTQDQFSGMVAGSPVAVGDLVISNNKVRTLAYVLNDQLHNVREQIFTLDQELKKMAKGVEFALMRAKYAGMSELVSIDQGHFTCTCIMNYWNSILLLQI